MKYKVLACIGAIAFFGGPIFLGWIITEFLKPLGFESEKVFYWTGAALYVIAFILWHLYERKYLEGKPMIPPLYGKKIIKEIEAFLDQEDVAYYLTCHSEVKSFLVRSSWETLGNNRRRIEEYSQIQNGFVVAAHLILHDLLIDSLTGSRYHLFSGKAPSGISVHALATIFLANLEWLKKSRIPLLIDITPAELIERVNAMCPGSYILEESEKKKSGE